MQWKGMEASSREEQTLVPAVTVGAPEADHWVGDRVLGEN